jgi:hypothetical protein
MVCSSKGINPESKNQNMNQKIIFHDLKSLAEFMKVFVGVTQPENGEPINPSTATFTVQKESGNWVLNFTGGY